MFNVPNVFGVEEKGWRNIFIKLCSSLLTRSNVKTTEKKRTLKGMIRDKTEGVFAEMFTTRVT